MGWSKKSSKIVSIFANKKESEEIFVFYLKEESVLHICEQDDVPCPFCGSSSHRKDPLWPFRYDRFLFPFWIVFSMFFLLTCIIVVIPRIEENLYWDISQYYKLSLSLAAIISMIAGYWLSYFCVRATLRKTKTARGAKCTKCGAPILILKKKEGV